MTNKQNMYKHIIKIGQGKLNNSTAAAVIMSIYIKKKNLKKIIIAEIINVVSMITKNVFKKSM